MAETFKFVRGSTEIIFDASMLPIKITRQRSQNVVVTENDTVYVYDRGVTKRFYAFKISTERSNDTFADITDVNSFIENEAVFQLNTFELHPPDDIDLGEGDGVLVSVRWWNDSLIEIQNRVQIYDYDIVLKKN